MESSDHINPSTVNYTALARRYRPQSFADVVGQDRIATTLRNAILEGRVAHGYLFTGARGVGKTSMARIFAKALNCPHAIEAVPCNDCELCKGISAGQDVDVSEIDGASNRGIDDIRALRANVNVKSMRSKYKIYIIDEVHMLTKEAFNALLKTLEEPPPMVKFVFCTTEPHKVPDTILSRCQRFDFGTVAIDKISDRLRHIASSEGRQVEPEAIALVARRAAGSMRDSQSLFDQLLAGGSERISAADVHRLLGTAPDERLVELVDALIDRHREIALKRFHLALEEGVQVDALTDQLINYFRDLMVLACGAHEVPLLSVDVSLASTVANQAKRWGLQTITAAMQILAEAKGRAQRVTYGRALAELALIRISLLAELDRLDELIIQWQKRDPSGGKGIPLGQSPSLALEPPSSASIRPAAVLPVSVAESTDEKKNEIAPERAPVTQSYTAPPSSDTPQPSQAQQATSLATADKESSQHVPSNVLVPFSAGSESEILKQIVGRFNDITGTYLKKIANIAISGPNQLLLSFPASYDLGRKGCDRPEVTARVVEAVREITGVACRIQWGTVADSPPQSEVREVKPVPAVPKPAGRRAVEDPQDEFVKEVGAFFGIGTWFKSELAVAAGTENESDSESREE